MFFGNMGKFLKIDLSAEKVEQGSIDEDLYIKYLGGWGINNKLFYDYRISDIDPFDPVSPIIIGVGALVGTKFPGSGKLVATYKSPIISKPKQNQHFIDHAVAGSFLFGRMLKKAGFDHIIIIGKAKKPTTIKIFEEDIEFLSSEGIWGTLDLYETSFYYRNKNQFPNCGIIAIGRGGEKKVRYALAIVDCMATLGKFGFGAVLGSKNIKAIITYGRKEIAIKDPEKLTELIKPIQQDVKKIPILNEFRKYGINSGFDFQIPLVNEGNFPFKEWKRMYGLREWNKVQGNFKVACNSCLLRCRISFELKEEGPSKGLKNYSGSFFLPARIGNRLEIRDEDKISKVVKLYDMCNRAGICFFTATGLINWITRLYKSGKIKKDKINLHLEREFSVYKMLLEKIIERSDIGDILAEGWYPTGEFLDADPTIFKEGTGLFKGSDSIQDGRFTTIDPQRFTYITNPRPHHGGSQSIYTIPKVDVKVLKTDLLKMGVSIEELNRVFTETPYYGPFNVGLYAKHAEDVMAVHNSLGSCIVYTLFSLISLQSLAPIYSAVTGRLASPSDLKKIGERNFNFYKMLNMYEGFSSRDEISKIWLTPRTTPDGDFSLNNYYRTKELSVEDLENLLNDYYTERGWDLNGNPTNEKLEELELKFLKLYP